MIMMKKTLTLFMILLVFIPSFYQVYAIRPNYVYDWDDMLTDEQENIINDYCSSVDTNITAEIVVITLKDSEGRTQEEARLYYYNEYPLDGVKGIGKEGKDNGVLLIICLKDNFWGIEVGYGLEGDLTDSESGRIGRDILVTNLKDSKDFDAIFGTVKAIAKEIGYGPKASNNQKDPVVVEIDEKTKNLMMNALIGIVAIGILGSLVCLWKNSIDSKWKQELRSQRITYNNKLDSKENTISNLNEKIQELTPPIHQETCPNCKGVRNCEETYKVRNEAPIDGFYYTWIAYHLICRGCDTSFEIETEKIQGESIEDRKERLERERLAEIKRQKEEEERRRRRIRNDSYHSHSYSSSSRSSGGSFGGGFSGGGGAGGSIR